MKCCTVSLSSRNLKIALTCTTKKIHDESRIVLNVLNVLNFREVFFSLLPELVFWERFGMMWNSQAVAASSIKRKVNSKSRKLHRNEIVRKNSVVAVDVAND